jgi:hypothetical protein
MDGIKHLGRGLDVRLSDIEMKNPLPLKFGKPGIRGQPSDGRTLET